MQDLTSEALNIVAHRSNLNYSTVRYCLECAVSQVMCEFFGVEDCEVDLDKKNVLVTFHVGSDMEIEEAELFTSDPVYNDRIPAEFSFEVFRRDTVDEILEVFKDILREVEADELEKKWRKKVHKAVEGVIEEKYPDRIEVDLGADVNGVMYKAEWTPREIPSYRQGKPFLFYVLKVVRRGSAVDVHLSRGSIGLPAEILKTLVPWAKVKTIRRIRGRKTWVRVRPAVPTEVLRDVSTKLNGEVVEVLT